MATSAPANQPAPERFPADAPGDGLQPITTEAIDVDARKVVRRLVRHGHEAYLVGGCVRDLLLGRTPKDFDVATSATPPEIKKLFRNSRIIGRRFRLAHIFFGRKIIETSTFRAPPAPPSPETTDVIIRRDNVFGTAREDAMRRDFTINGLFLDLEAGQVIDHVDGLPDLRTRCIRTIGDPLQRMQEDPVRAIRAVKFATRLDFGIAPHAETAMVQTRQLLSDCSVARIQEELFRLLASGHAAPSLRMMHRLGLLAVLLPEVNAVLGPPDDARARQPVIPLHDRSGTPRNEEPTDAAPPRDAGPDHAAVRMRPPPDEEELQRFQEQSRQLTLEMVGNDERALNQAAETTWQHLEGLDRLARETPPETRISHSLLLACPLMGLAWAKLQPETPINESLAALEQLVKSFSARMRVSRRDRELLKQLLIAYRRMVHRGKRRRPLALMQRDYFADAWQLFNMSCAVTGAHADDVARWRQMMSQHGRGGRSRRRRGRRRRPRGKRQDT